MTLGAPPPDHSVTAEGNVSSRKRRVANLVPLRQQSPMALLYAKVVERCSHPCSPLASDPPARPFGAQTGNLPYSRTVVNNVGFVDNYPINDSFRTLQYHVLPKISIARCLKRSTFFRPLLDTKRRIQRNRLQSIFLPEILERHPDRVSRFITVHEYAETTRTDMLPFFDLNTDNLIAFL